MKTKLLRLLAAGGIVAATMVPAVAAHADYGVPGGGGNPGSGDQGQPGSQGTPGSNSAGGGTLPFTGGDVAGLALIGGSLAVGGVVLVQVNRRRRFA